MSDVSASWVSNFQLLSWEKKKRERKLYTHSFHLRERAYVSPRVLLLVNWKRRALGIERICFQGLHHVFQWEYTCCKWIWLQALEFNPVASFSVGIFILDLKVSDVRQLCSMQNHSTLLAVLVGQFHIH